MPHSVQWVMSAHSFLSRESTPSQSHPVRGIEYPLRAIPARHNVRMRGMKRRWSRCQRCRATSDHWCRQGRRWGQRALVGLSWGMAPVGSRFASSVAILRRTPTAISMFSSSSATSSMVRGREMDSRAVTSPDKGQQKSTNRYRFLTLHLPHCSHPADNIRCGYRLSCLRERCPGAA